MFAVKIREKSIGKKRQIRLLAVLLVPVVALIMGADAPESGAAERFDDTKIIIELNATDRDAGIQVFLDGEPWKEVEIISPDEEILEVEADGNLLDFGLTELFFESNEPPFDELPLDEFLELFPAGIYRFKGRTVEGVRLRGAARLTHVIPAGPDLVSPEEGEEVDPNDTVIEWEPVTERFIGSGNIKIVGYQVVVEREDPLRVFSVDVSADTTMVTIPPEFLEPGTDYKFEVLAIEESGNQTISEREFETE
jgi:hypothetical protein